MPESDGGARGGRGATAVGLAVRFVAAAVGRLPGPAAGWLGRRLGDLGGLALRRRHRVALANLERAFPSLSVEERRRLCRRSWQHLGLMSVELSRLLVRPVEETVAELTMDGSEHLRAAMAAHGRALVLTAHLGNWEYLALAHRLAGYPLAIVVRPLESPGLNAVAEMLRRKTGVELIDKRGALRPVLDALRRGRLVAVLLDQNAVRRESVFVPFFGRPASTSRSLALLAVRTRTPIVPVFIRRDEHGRHRVTVRPPLLLPTSNGPDGAVVELTERCTRVIEAAIRETPEQWLWSHDRWRTRAAPGSLGGRP